MVTCYPSYDMTPPLPSPAQCGASAAGVSGGPGGSSGAKDYSRPLHVDCSVEYELPDAAKPPAGQRSEPLLMIHPCYYRRAEAQRRTRFVNNLPKSMSSPVTSSSSSGRRSKVPRLASSSAAVEPAWPQPKPLSVPVYPANVANQPSSCYKVGATADFSTSSWPGRTPAAPSSAKLDAGAVLSDIIASTCSELNNNYMKPSGQQSSSHSASFDRQHGSAAAPAASSYGYHHHPHQQHEAASASCKTCQYQPHHSHHSHHHSSHHSSSGGSGGSTSGGAATSSSSSQPHPASQATQANRLYGGGLVKAAEPDLAAVPAKARRCGVKRSRPSRALPASQDCARASGGAGATGATPNWSDAMLHLNAATGFSFESAAPAAARLRGLGRHVPALPGARGRLGPGAVELGQPPAPRPRLAKACVCVSV